VIRESTFACLLPALWSSGDCPVHLLWRLRATAVCFSPARARSTTPEFSTSEFSASESAASECSTDLRLACPGPSRSVPVLSFNPGASWKEGLEVVRRICRKRQHGVDLPELWQDVLAQCEVSPGHAGLRHAKTAIGYVMRIASFSRRAATPSVSIFARMSASKSARMRSLSPGLGKDPARSSTRSRSMR
jgi:hypothetical protein